VVPEDRGSDSVGMDAVPRAGENQADYRERMASLQAEAIERRQHELSEQRSPQHAPADRIRIWERLHQLALPASPNHRLLNVIAAATGLSLEEVQTEQGERAAAGVKHSRGVI
jgi:hypothetical protein